MAGRTLTVDMHDDDLVPAWRTVIEIGATGSQLTLVGGLMVAAHARRAGVLMSRPTDDLDVLADYRVNRSALTETRAALGAIGFHLSADEAHAYRFRHDDGRKVDLMVADHLPSKMTPRLDRRPAFAAPSGEQAIRRRDIYRLRFRGGRRAEVGVPDEFGALVAKGAAWLVDRRDRGRHLDDAAVVLACIDDVSEIDFDAASANDRKRIHAVTSELADRAHPAWIGLDAADRTRGHTVLALIQQGLGL